MKWRALSVVLLGALGLAGCAREEARKAGVPERAPGGAVKSVKSETPSAAAQPAAASATATIESKDDLSEHKAVARSIHEFRPSVDGFAFVNSFSGSSLPVDLGVMERKLGLPNRFGLCGGMSAAAADYFLAGKKIPPETSAPDRGSRLYTYIYGRQAASLGPVGAMSLKFAEWMKLSDEEVEKRTREELPRILEMVERGDVVVLGLVLEGPKGTAWDNHQVLAYGVVRRSGGVDVNIYDPNFPKQDDVKIRVIDDGRVMQIGRVGPGTRGRDIRGVFRMPYEPVVPKSER